MVNKKIHKVIHIFLFSLSTLLFCLGHFQCLGLRKHMDWNVLSSS